MLKKNGYRFTALALAFFVAMLTSSAIRIHAEDSGEGQNFTVGWASQFSQKSGYSTPDYTEEYCEFSISYFCMTEQGLKCYCSDSVIVNVSRNSTHFPYSYMFNLYDADTYEYARDELGNVVKGTITTFTGSREVVFTVYNHAFVGGYSIDDGYHHISEDDLESWNYYGGFSWRSPGW